MKAFACTKEKTAANEITKWLQNGKEPALLAVDAPLGWPQTLSRVLATHRAGEELRADAHVMFRRATDIFIKQKTGKTPLDVGADRIARAFASKVSSHSHRASARCEKGTGDFSNRFNGFSYGSAATRCAQ